MGGGSVQETLPGCPEEAIDLQVGNTLSSQKHLKGKACFLKKEKEKKTDFQSQKNDL